MIIFLTGAGLSANSGLPTYRGVGGLYSGDNIAAHGMTIEEFLSPENRAIDPEGVASYIQAMAERLSQAEPNEIHYAIARAEAEFGDRCLVFTQNIDVLHEQAGTTNIHHLHGNALNPVLFGENIDSYILGEMDWVVPRAKICFIIGTSVQFDYLVGWLAALAAFDCQLVLLDTDTEHMMIGDVAYHASDPSKFATIINQVIDQSLTRLD